MILPKLIVTDIDGVWTDGSMYYDQLGNELKRFHTYDSAGVLFCRKWDIEVAIMTGEETEIVRRRAEKLKVEYVFQGVKDKVACAEQLLKELGLAWGQVAYIGDDINDIGIIKKAGYTACPSNANFHIKTLVDKVLDVKGGDGAFRSFVEEILAGNGLLDETYKSL